MEGHLEEIIDALDLSEQTDKLKELNNGELYQKLGCGTMHLTQQRI